MNGFLRDRDAILRSMRSHLLQARDRMKSVADCHRRDVEYEVGDLVYLKLHPCISTNFGSVLGLFKTISTILWSLQDFGENW